MNILYPNLFLLYSTKSSDLRFDTDILCYGYRRLNQNCHVRLHILGSLGTLSLYRGLMVKIRKINMQTLWWNSVNFRASFREILRTSFGNSSWTKIKIPALRSFQRARTINSVKKINLFPGTRVHNI